MRAVSVHAGGAGQRLLELSGRFFEMWLSSTTIFRMVLSLLHFNPSSRGCRLRDASPVYIYFLAKGLKLAMGVS